MLILRGDGPVTCPAPADSERESGRERVGGIEHLLGGGDDPGAAGDGGHDRLVLPHPIGVDQATGERGAEKGLVDEVRLEVQPAAGVDRKSTRLNSSHVAISYAVFCV